MRGIPYGKADYGKFKADWFDPRTGEWFDAGGGTLTADATGKITLPNFPGDNEKSAESVGQAPP